MTKTQLKELKTETYDALVTLEASVRAFDLAFLGGVCPDDGPPPKPSLEEFQRLVWTMKDAVTTLDQATRPKRETEEEEHECEEEEDHECEEEDCKDCRRGLYCDCMDTRCPSCARK
jgi:hypothetical protein